MTVTGFAPSADGDMPGFLNLLELEERAREALDVPTYAFLAGGAGEEHTLRRNREAFSRWSLLPRVLVDVSGVSTRAEVLGRTVSLPVLLSPMGMQQLVHTAGECEMARAAAEAETIMCLSAVSSRSPADVAGCGGPLWQQLYPFRDQGLTQDIAAQAEQAGCEALVLTVDGPVIARRERAIRAGFSLPRHIRVPASGPALGVRGGVGPDELVVDRTLTWAALDRIAAGTSLPLVLKGILSPRDAALACEHGVAAVIVSNHGGRQLDGAPASLDVLAAVVEAVAGRAEVLLDGGVRRGTDVLTALALGARAVLIGRPAYWGLALDGARGVRHVIELLRAELEQALALLGCSRPADVDRSHLLPADNDMPTGGQR